MILEILAILLNVIRDARRYIFAAFCSNFVDKYNEVGRPHKVQLFTHLNQSIRDKPRGEGMFKLLEVGGGSGANFEFLTEPVDWTVVEPNVCFAPYFKENLKDNSKMKADHRFNDLVEACGEDMSVFPDNSFDAVVITLVLCSVSDVDQTLAEVKRVLKPGGSFYFIEHVVSHNSTGLRLVQNILSMTQIWPCIMDGCYLNRDTFTNLKNAGFGKLEVERYIFSEGIGHRIFCSHIRGRATKRA